MTNDTSKEIALIEKEIKNYLPAGPVKITTEEEKARAAEDLSVLNRYAKRVKTRKEEITKPMNAALKSARELFHGTEEKLDEAIQQLRTGLGTYQLAAENARLEEEKKIADRVKEGKGNLRPETAVAKIEALDRPAASVATASGSVKFRTDKKLKITNRAELMKSVCEFAISTGDYDMLELVESQVKAFILSEPTKSPFIRGAEIEEVKTVINSL